MMSILLDLLSASPEVIGCCIRSWWCIRGSNRTTCIINKQTASACLSEGGIPEYLDIQIGDNKAAVRVRPGSVLIPVARIELQEELGDSAIPKLRDRCLLQGIKPGLPVIDMPQGAERQSKNRVVAAH